MKQVRKILKEMIGLSFLFLFLAGTMCIPGNVILAEASEGYGTKITGGNCGASGNKADVTWAVYDSDADGDGIANTEDTLVLDGNGAMADFNSWSNMAPWEAYKNKITKVIFEDGSGVTSIGEYAFYNCSSLRSIDLPSGITSIGEYAFYNCSSLRSIDLPSGITSIGEYASLHCSSLSSIDLPEGITSIGNYAFYGCRSLSSIDLPEGITSIGVYAFYGCRSLSSIDLPEGITSIGEYAFYDCSSLSSIDLSLGITSIGAYAFSGCSSLSSIDLPSGVTSIGEGVFSACNNLSISVNEENRNYSSENGVLYNKEKNILLAVPRATGNYIIPNGVTVIGARAFSGCSGLSSIEIPIEVTSIGKAAFYGCSSLRSIDLPEGVTSIGEAAFYNCSSLRSIDLPEGVTSIGEYAFFNCSSLRSIDLPEGVTSIGEYAFCNCSSLRSIDLPSGITSIGEGAFYNCSSLSSIEIPVGVTMIVDKAFYYCSGLSSIVLPSGITYEGYPLDGCYNLKEVYYHNSSNAYPNGKVMVSYDIKDDSVSLKVERVSADVENITIPETIARKPVSSLEYAEGIDTSQIKVICTKHYPATGGWGKDKDGHWGIGCVVCKEEKFPHNFGDGTEECECGYIPFEITTQPQGKTWAYGTESDEERTLSVEVTKTMGDEDIAYQWYEGDSVIDGATESAYVVPKEKSVSTYEYYCMISCDGYSMKSDAVTAVVKNFQGVIHVEEGKENIVLTYGKEPVALEGITKTGEGSLVFTVTEGNDILSVSEEGQVTFKKVGTAVITINMPETENYTKAETKNITVTVKANYPAITPETPVAVANTVKKVSEVSLPDNWEWESEDAKKTLPAGKDLEVTANYTGDDKEFYYNTSVKVILQRADCTSGDNILYTGEGEKAPTCTEEGKGHRECTLCGDVLESDITVPVIRHTLSPVSKVEPDCTTSGKAAHFSCSECKKFFIDEQGSKEVTESSLIMKALDHTGGEANCTKKAVCTRCKKEYGELNKNKHGETEVKNAKEATCTEKGYTGDICCKDCKEKLSSGKEVEVLDHIGGEANCTKKAVCTRCKKEYGELNKNKHGETEVKNVKEATCTEKGYTGDTCCKDCKEKLSSGKELEVLDHTGGEANCTKKAVCTACKKEYGELNKNKHSETEVKNAKEATCMETGYTGDVYCKGCGEKISSGKEIPLSQHQLGKAESKEATCITEGQKEHWSCLVCEKMFSDKEGSNEITEDIVVIPAKGHIGTVATCHKKAYCIICESEYGEVDKNNHGEKEVKDKKEATCKAEGYTGDVCCKDCGEKISKGETTEKTAHTWDGGVITKEATETEKGIKTYTCSGCEETKTEEIPATGKVVTPEKPGTVTPTPIVKPGEVITPEIPSKVTPTPTVKPSATPVVTQKPTEKPSKDEQKAPKKGTILTDKKSNGKYKVLVAGKNGTVEYVSPLNKKSTKATIPATVKINGITYKVVSIAKNAFKNNKSITKVTIGKNVKTIGANAFYGCKKLKSVSMGKNITSIGDKAFYKCTAITKITIPSQVKKLGKQTFYGCKKLKTITIKTTKLTKKNVGSKAFMGIYKKATIKVPKSKVKVYQKLLKSKGISKTVKVKK